MSENLCSFENDLLDRKNLAVNLTKIIERSSEAKVIAIDSSWGSGKTTFVKMWLNMLSNEECYKDKYSTIYFNAWENDYIKDPLLALLAEIEKVNQNSEGKVKKIYSSMIKNGKRFIKPLINVPLKVCTQGSLSTDDFKVADPGQHILDNIKEQKKLREDFVTEIQKYSEEDRCNIVFFIDELDRCRPIFAIELLETMKHLFNAEGITFVVSIDKEQLGYSISTLYGNGMDSDGYLRRFFDIEYKIPVKNKRKYIDIKNNKIFENYKNTEYIKVFLRELFLRDYYSFRDIDKTYKYLEVLIPVIEEFNQDKNYIKPYIIALSYILANIINFKIKHASLYKDILNYNYNPNELYLQEMLSFNTIRDINFDIQGYSDEKLKQFVEPSIVCYLILINFKNNGVNKLDTLYKEEEKFCIGAKKDNGGFIEGTELNMLHYIKAGKMNIIELMEFIDDIEWK